MGARISKIRQSPSRDFGSVCSEFDMDSSKSSRVEKLKFLNLHNSAPMGAKFSNLQQRSTWVLCRMCTKFGSVCSFRFGVVKFQTSMTPLL